MEIIKVDTENNCILVKGSIPGPKKGLVIIKSAVKTDNKNDAFDFITYEDEAEEKVDAPSNNEEVEIPTEKEVEPESEQKEEEPQTNDKDSETPSKEEA